MKRNIAKVLVVLCLVAAAACSKPAPEATVSSPIPDSASALAFIEFYENGQGHGVVVADLALCGDVPNEGDRKYDCVDRVTGEGALAEGEYWIWAMFVVPKGDTVDGIKLQLLRDGLVVASQDVTVQGSIRYRVRKKVRIDGAGTYSVQVVQQKPEGVALLSELRIENAVSVKSHVDLATVSASMKRTAEASAAQAAVEESARRDEADAFAGMAVLHSVDSADCESEFVPNGSAFGLTKITRSNETDIALRLANLSPGARFSVHVNQAPDGCSGEAVQTVTSDGTGSASASFAVDSVTGSTRVWLSVREEPWEEGKLLLRSDAVEL